MSPRLMLNESEAPGPLCEVRLRKGDVSIGLIGAVLTLGTPQDITLQELRVEMFMPADSGSPRHERCVRRSRAQDA